MNIVDKKLLNLADAIAQQIMTISDEKKRVKELHATVQQVHDGLIKDDLPKDQAKITCQFLFSCVVERIKPHDPTIDEYIDTMVAELQMIPTKYREVYIGTMVDKIMPLPKHELGKIILRITKRLQNIDSVKGMH